MSLSENSYLVIMLFLAFFIFTLIGAGNALVISCMGVLLCMVGLMQSSVKVDLWVLIPLLIYTGINFLSGYRTYGNMVSGLASTQSIFPVIYLLVAYLNTKEHILLKKLCVFWIGIMAYIGIGEFVMAVFSNSASRLSGIMGNPNAMGSMFVLGWFALQSCLLNITEENSKIKSCLQSLVFIDLVALTLTLSFGSFGALGIGVIIMHIYSKEGLSSFISRMAEIIFAGGCGILLYIAGVLAVSPWLCILLCIYILIVSFHQDTMKLCFKDKKWISILICAVGIGSIGILLYLRPNAIATFTERLAMIKNGLSYFGTKPFLGVGPYQWRTLNLYDADIYFNTWHIHNAFIHVGVELGLIAFTMLIVIIIRHSLKKEDSPQRGMFFATLTHNMMDTSFFYMATVPFVMLIGGKDEKKSHFLNEVLIRCIFGFFAVLFTCNLFQCLS